MAQVSESDSGPDERLYYRELVRNTIHVLTDTDFETVILTLDSIPPDEFVRFQLEPRVYLEEHGVDVPQELEVSVDEKNSRCINFTIWGRKYHIGTCTD
jgi:hypothetical protein